MLKSGRTRSDSEWITFQHDDDESICRRTVPLVKERRRIGNNTISHERIRESRAGSAMVMEQETGQIL